MPSRLPSSCRAAALRARPLHRLQTRSAAAIVHQNLATTSSSTSAASSRSSAPAPARTPVLAPARRTRPHGSCSQSPRPSSSSLLPPRRTYHSYDHPAPERPFSPPERAILAAAYAHVPSHGFSREALVLGARDAGYLDISTNLLPEGVFSLIRWHLVSQREALAGRAQDLFGPGKDKEQDIGVGRKVEMLAWARLMGNKEVIGRWQEALAIMVQPSYVPGSAKELAELSDEIWFLAGDVSVDPSWYTKRASLSAVYASTELFMTTDRSEGFFETRKFLRRRLEEVQDIGGSLRSLGQWVGFTASAGLNVLRSKGVRI